MHKDGNEHACAENTEVGAPVESSLEIQQAQNVSEGSLNQG
jgi:hypothetical protein